MFAFARGAAVGARALRQVAQRGRRAFSLPSHEVFGLPALSPTMEAGTIAVWKVKEGAAFAAGDVICEIETDKATVDFEAQDDGVLAKILVDMGVEVKVGDPICVIVEAAADVAAFANFAGGAAPAAAAAAPALRAEAEHRKARRRRARLRPARQRDGRCALLRPRCARWKGRRRPAVPPLARPVAKQRAFGQVRRCSQGPRRRRKVTSLGSQR
mmetsp:Transcript_27406/g.94247  ORF Transcript_27406/g.94247 Transcript_27406/m.94247 type:complete len:214 (-) Transcript_27406:1728-2369(-)